MYQKTGFFELFARSARELKDLRKLVIMSLLIAMNIAVSFFDITVSKDLFISFGFVFMAICGFLFGPTATCMVGIVTDILEWVINSKGYPFNIGFTINAAVAGIIYGLCLYRKNYKSEYFIIWCTVSKILVNLIINIFLTPIWMKGFYGFIAGQIFTTLRIFKNVMMLPIELLIIFFLIKSVAVIARRMKLIDY